MANPAGFEWAQRKNGDVVIHHRGRLATTLRGRRALDLLSDLDAGEDVQELLARITGNYRRGNERVARGHRRNRNRRH